LVGARERQYSEANVDAKMEHRASLKRFFRKRFLCCFMKVTLDSVYLFSVLSGVENTRQHAVGEMMG